jgi:hypothetical protein
LAFNAWAPTECGCPKLKRMQLGKVRGAQHVVKGRLSRQTSTKAHSAANDSTERAAGAKRSPIRKYLYLRSACGAGARCNRCTLSSIQSRFRTVQSECGERPCATCPLSSQVVLLICVALADASSAIEQLLELRRSVAIKFFLRRSFLTQSR